MKKSRFHFETSPYQLRMKLVSWLFYAQKHILRAGTGDPGVPELVQCYSDVLKIFTCHTKKNVTNLEITLSKLTLTRSDVSIKLL